MVEIKPFKGTRPYNEDAKNLIAPSTDHLSIENIEIFKKNNYWNYLKIKVKNNFQNTINIIFPVPLIRTRKIANISSSKNNKGSKIIGDHFRPSFLKPFPPHALMVHSILPICTVCTV